MILELPVCEAPLNVRFKPCCEFRTRSSRSPGRWWCGWRTWCGGRVPSRRAGAAAWSRRPAGPTACTSLCRPVTTTAATPATRAASRSKSKPRVRRRSAHPRPVSAAQQEVVQFTCPNPCFSFQTTWWRLRASKYSVTPSTAASAPSRGASKTVRETPGCRTPTCWPWGESRRCPAPGWCTAGTPSTIRRWRVAPASPGSSVSAVCTCSRTFPASVQVQMIWGSFFLVLLWFLMFPTCDLLQDVHLSVCEGDLARGEAAMVKTPRPPASQSPGLRGWRFVWLYLICGAIFFKLTQKVDVRNSWTSQHS